MGIVRWSSEDRESLRGALRLPSVTRTGVRYVDGESGGAWRAANEFGVAVRIVSGARLSGARTEWSAVSGVAELAAELIGFEDIQGVCGRLLSLDLEPYAPFALAISEPGLPTAIAEWDGRECPVLLNGDPFLPLLFGPSQPANLMP